MRVGVVQFCAADDQTANLEQAVKFTRAALEAGAQVVALPENFSQLEQDDQGYLAHCGTEAMHPALPIFSELAKSYAAHILLGSVTVKTQGGRVNNRSLLIDQKGDVIARYNKIHLFDVDLPDDEGYRESRVVEPGTEAVVVDIAGITAGLSICYDLRFPALYRALAQAGATILFAPAAFTQVTGEAHWHTLIRTRAIENGCYVIAPNQCGVRPWGRATYGHSLVVDPWGRVLLDAGPDPGFSVIDIDLAEVARVRAMVPSLKHDRPFQLVDMRPGQLSPDSFGSG